MSLCVHAELMLPDAFNNGNIDMLIHASPPGGSTPNSKAETPNVKKRHRRAKSGTNKTEPGQDGGEFTTRTGTVVLYLWVHSTRIKCQIF